LDFAENRFSGDYQGCPVINYCDIDIPYTRIIEHKHLAPWEKRKSTVIHKEYSRYCESGDMPYYPLRFATEDTLLQKYVHKADLEKGVTFVGRLGTHRYIDMDVAVKEALETAKAFIQSEKGNGKLRTFMVRPS
jgi:UDP-galactopyranose mutase